METPTEPTFEAQARACWLMAMTPEAREEGHKAALDAAGTTCHRATRNADALAMARDILAPLADEKYALSERAVSELIHRASVWMSLYGRPETPPASGL